MKRFMCCDRSLPPIYERKEYHKYPGPAASHDVTPLRFSPGFSRKMRPEQSASLYAPSEDRVSHGTSFLAPGSLARRRLARSIHHHHHPLLVWWSRPPASAGKPHSPRPALPSTARSMMAGRAFLVLTGACQFDHGVGGFATNFIHSGSSDSRILVILLWFERSSESPAAAATEVSGFLAFFPARSRRYARARQARVRVVGGASGDEHNANSQYTRKTTKKPRLTRAWERAPQAEKEHVPAPWLLTATPRASSTTHRTATRDRTTRSSLSPPPPLQTAHPTLPPPL